MMILDSLAFQAMQSRLNGLGIEQKVILHNLANYETPNFKAKKISFEDVLSETTRRTGRGKFDFKAKVWTDEATEMRPDGNNVDSDVESMELYRNYVETLYLYEKIGGQFTNLNYILEQAAK
ncbi:MAG: flagellar basal body rod protein FlgB [Anaerotruncus sp.]|nr:flagellar basal body rod protein FlgB [Anaerotruncus sp.]